MLSGLVCCLLVVAGDAQAARNGTCDATEGSTCSSVLLQRSDRVSRVELSTEETSELQDEDCDEALWPDKDHGLVCGKCKVLVDRFDSFYGTCANYCSKVGRQCVAAWEEKNENCTEAYPLTCDQTLSSSDAICQCGAKLSATLPIASVDTCYRELNGVAITQGNGIGVPKIVTQSVPDCQNACDGNDDCKSFTLCPKWNGCWLKDHVMTGGEVTKVEADCKTYFKTACNEGSQIQPPTARATAPPRVVSQGVKIRCVSYNLFWWHAFDQNSLDGVHVTDNIKNTLNADTLSVQECDDPGLIQSRTQYTPVSPFKGAQGIFVKPGLFEVGEHGFRDIQATGKWGKRFVTWVQLTHTGSGLTFWQFNTHWCVHTGNGNTCNSQTRYEGAKNMLTLIQEKARGAPVVITGDFNAMMDEDGPKHFLRNGFDIAINKWVDAIFYSKAHWTVSWSGGGDAAKSDHRPVIAELELIV
jgi:hypothetical protein